jgi:CII-binding regulator of phage lambda lysogenization HflD
MVKNPSNYGKYVTFDETIDTNILEFFKELSRYAEGILQLECLIKREKLMVRQIEEKIRTSGLHSQEKRY